MDVHHFKGLIEERTKPRQIEEQRAYVADIPGLSRTIEDPRQDAAIASRNSRYR